MRRKLTATAGAILCAALWSAAPASASTTWQVQTVPAPANPGTVLQSVSCPATGVCVAVGYYFGSTGTQLTLAERWAGGHWTVQSTPNPGIGGVDQLTGVSCLSATDCTAVGIDSTRTAGNSTLVEHWDGTRWTVVPNPDPASTTTDFVGVSCASATSCMATGLYDVQTGNRSHEAPLAEHWDGTSWTIQHVPVPAGSTSAALDGGVSCPSATDCIAVGAAGFYGTPSNTQPLAERWNGTSWTIQATPAVPADAYNPYLGGVSCTSPAGCTAVGGYLVGNAGTPLVERWDGTSWTTQTDAASYELDGVSCTSSESCTAIGVAFDSVAEHWDGTSWTLQPLPIPHDTTRPVTASGVSCVSATTCTVVGIYGRSPHPVAWHE